MTGDTFEPTTNFVMIFSRKDTRTRTPRIRTYGLDESNDSSHRQLPSRETPPNVRIRSSHYAQRPEGEAQYTYCTFVLRGSPSSDRGERWGVSAPVRSVF